METNNFKILVLFNFLLTHKVDIIFDILKQKNSKNIYWIKGVEKHEKNL